MPQWTRKRIIQAILQREQEGQPLNFSSIDPIDSALYQAGSRIFGSWPNALAAAGISSRATLSGKEWQPAKILSTIRQLARRKRRLTVSQVETRHPALVSAARRIFGSWPKAVIAAGIDPQRFQRVRPWTHERILEAILIRALRGEPLSTSTTRPRSLVDAAQRVFGSWQAAKVAAGIKESESQSQGRPLAHIRPPDQRWTDSAIIRCIHARQEKQMSLKAVAVKYDDNSLYRGAQRRFGNWRNALNAAGLVLLNDQQTISSSQLPGTQVRAT